MPSRLPFFYRRWIDTKFLFTDLRIRIITRVGGKDEPVSSIRRCVHWNVSASNVAEIRLFDISNDFIKEIGVLQIKTLDVHGVPIEPRRAAEKFKRIGLFLGNGDEFLQREGHVKDWTGDVVIEFGSKSVRIQNIEFKDGHPFCGQGIARVEGFLKR